jgi:hypothetical protein
MPRALNRSASELSAEPARTTPPSRLATRSAGRLRTSQIPASGWRQLAHPKLAIPANLRAISRPRRLPARVYRQAVWISSP